MTSHCDVILSCSQEVHRDWLQQPGTSLPISMHPQKYCNTLQVLLQRFILFYFICADGFKAFESYHIKGGKCEHLVTCGYSQSRDTNGSHTIWSAIVENPMLHANLTALSFIEPELWAIEVYIDVFGSCDLDLDPMTFIYELDPYCVELYRMCKYELPTWSLSKVIVWLHTYIHTYRQTDKQTDRI